MTTVNKTENMTVAEYRALMAEEKTHRAKYNNRVTEVDGIKFDSEREANRYCELKLLEQAGLITDLKLQPEFILQEGFRKRGKWYREIKYIADFRYKDIKNGEDIVEDVKGFKTKEFRMKEKMFEDRYPELSLRLV